MSMESRLLTIAKKDVDYVVKRNAEYGESWCRRGGQQAFAVIWRKADRIESIVKKMNNGFDIFAAWEQNPGDVRDDLRDLRQYLLLLEEYLEREEMTKLHFNHGKPPLTYPPGVRAATQFDSGVPQGKGYVDQD